MTVLDKYILKEYDVGVSGVRAALLGVIGVAAEMVFRKNPNRIMFVLVNLSANIVYLAFEGDVDAAHGIRLNALGGMMISSIKDDAALTQEEVWIIADGANSDIYGLEVVEV